MEKNHLDEHLDEKEEKLRARLENWIPLRKKLKRGRRR